MIKFCLLFISIFTDIGWHINTVKNTNHLKELGAQYYAQQQYPKALQCYYELVNKHHAKDENIMLNLAHCYYQLGALEICKKIYLPLAKSTINIIKSQANTQLAMLEALNGRRSSALQYLKIALISQPENNIARYNYELLLKKNPNKKDKDPKRKTKVSNKNTHGKDAEKEEEGNSEDLENETGNNQDNPNSSSENNGSNVDKDGQNNKEKWNSKSIITKKQNMDKALLMLESIRQQEVNYLLQKKYNQQNKKSKSTMDW